MNWEGVGGGAPLGPCIWADCSPCVHGHQVLKGRNITCKQDLEQLPTIDAVSCVWGGGGGECACVCMCVSLCVWSGHTALTPSLCPPPPCPSCHGHLPAPPPLHPACWCAGAQRVHPHVPRGAAGAAVDRGAHHRPQRHGDPRRAGACLRQRCPRVDALPAPAPAPVFTSTIRLLVGVGACGAPGAAGLWTKHAGGWFWVTVPAAV